MTVPDRATDNVYCTICDIYGDGRVVNDESHRESKGHEEATSAEQDDFFERLAEASADTLEALVNIVAWVDSRLKMERSRGGEYAAGHDCGCCGREMVWKPSRAVARDGGRWRFIVGRGLMLICESDTCPLVQAHAAIAKATT